MTLSDLAALGSLVSGLAVLVSLVFLWFQFRQTERNQRAAISQAAITRNVQHNSALFAPDMSALVLKALTQPDELSEGDVWQLTGVMRNLILSFHEVKFQHDSHLADDIIFDYALRSIKFWMASPVFRAIYEQYRPTYSQELVAEVDRLIRDQPLRSFEVRPAEFRKRLAELIAIRDSQSRAP
ncbi:MAG: hypothetical protein JSR81_13400 [Proteobacteria bacterium]|nr:hypothetical protein [Pseudomonadota bacterium]